MSTPSKTQSLPARDASGRFVKRQAIVENSTFIVENSTFSDANTVSNEALEYWLIGIGIAVAATILIVAVRSMVLGQ